MTWLLIQALIEVVLVGCALGLSSRYSYHTLTDLYYYKYLVWSAIIFIVIGLVITMPECSKSGFIGIINWIIILLGGLMYFGLLAMRNSDEEGNKGWYFLILYTASIFGLIGYFKKDDIQYETCEVFPYIIIPQVLAGLLITLADSGHSGCLLFYTIIITLWGFSVKVSCEMIVHHNKKLMYKQGQHVAASQKMFTNLFVVLGECVYESFEKDATERDIAVTWE